MPRKKTLVPVKIQSELAEELTRAEKALEMCRTLSLATAQERDFAADVIRMARARDQQLEEEYLKAATPLKEGLAVIGSWFAPLRGLYQNCGELVQFRLDAKMDQLKSTVSQALDQVQESAGAAPADVLALAHSSLEGPAGTHQRRCYSVKVLDFALVPDAYKDLAESRAKSDLKAGIQIPGLELVETLKTVVRS